MDTIKNIPNSSIEISESNSYGSYGFNELNQRYKSLRESLELSLNIYNTPLIQKQLRDYHEALWSTLNLYKESFLPLKSEILGELESSIVNLFIFGDDVIGSTLDFKSLEDIESNSYLIKSVQQIVIKFLNVIEDFIITQKLPEALPRGEATKLLSSGELSANQWVGTPVRIKTSVES